jgi:predicted RNase H-like HicB family nuclease
MTRNVDELLDLSWTIVRTDAIREGVRYIELSVEELTGFMVFGSTPAEVEERFWPGLRLFLESYLEAGEMPPLPSTRAVRARFQRVQTAQVAVERKGDTAVVVLHRVAGSDDSTVSYTNRELAGV